MTSKHYAVYGCLLIGLAMQIGSLGRWADALRPEFVSGLLMTIGAVIGGTYIQPPKK